MHEEKRKIYIGPTSLGGSGTGNISTSSNIKKIKIWAEYMHKETKEKYI